MRAQDITPSAHEIMSAGPSHYELAIPISKIRPLRARAFVEVLSEVVSQTIIVPNGDPRDRKWWRGRVLALGLPSIEAMEWRCKVGDEVIFVLAVWLDKMRITRFVGVRGEVAVLAQAEILAVVNS